MMGKLPIKTGISWLDDLICKYPVLNKLDIDFIHDVCFSIRITRNEIKASEAQILEVKEMADKMKDKFKLVLRILKKSSTHQCFQEKYPEWRKWRDLNVRHLREIADSIEAQKKEFQGKKMGLSALSIAGGIILLATGGIMLRFLGTAVVGLSTAVATAIPNDEKQSLTKKIDKAKEVMQQDQEHFELLIDWLKEASSMQEAMDDIKSIGHNDALIPTEEIENVLKKNSSDSQKRKEIFKIFKTWNVPENMREDLADVVGILITIYLLINRLRPFWKTYHAISEVRSISAYSGIHSLVKCSQLTTNEKGKIRNVIFLDIINILFVASEDPKSVEAEEIRKVADEYEKEASELESLYEEMKPNDNPEN